MLERKGFSKEQFNDRHPGGKLGSILKRVSDLMHTGQEMPVLDEMTTKRLGCVGFVNETGMLTGILTDGDLRRCLSAQILDEKAVDLMTRNPKTISPEAMTAEALKIMHDKKITNLFVLEGGKPVGVIHIHDLLTNGVA